jgi:hypothetical protein
MHSPVDKMRCMVLCTVQITKAITDFYSGVDFDGKAGKLQIDADALINICIYVLIKCKVKSIFAHLKLANQFATSMMRNSKLGYVSSTFEVALEQILGLEPDHLSAVEDGTLSLTRRQTLQVRFSLRQCH